MCLYILRPDLIVHMYVPLSKSVSFFKHGRPKISDIDNGSQFDLTTRWSLSFILRDTYKIGNIYRYDSFQNQVRTRPFGRKEIDGLQVPPGNAYTLLTDHLITG